MDNNIDKIRQLVEDLSIRDNDLIEKVEHFDILQHVFLTSPRAMAIMESDWKYVLVNKLFAELYGFENPNDMVGKRHYELFCKIPERPIDEITTSLNKTGKWEGVIQCPHKGGESFTSKLTIQKVVEKDILICTCEVQLTK
jgi:PAS domain-containing protein